MTNKEIGQVLRDNRKRKGLTLKQVALLMSEAGEYNLLHHHLTNYETGKMNFTARFLNRYCRSIGCSFAFVLNDVIDNNDLVPNDV